MKQALRTVLFFAIIAALHRGPNHAFGDQPPAQIAARPPAQPDGQSAAPVIELRGEHEDPNRKFGKDAGYRLAADAKFGWKTSAISGDIDLNGHKFIMETGGGNRTLLSGRISGAGALEWIGGGVPQVAESILGGEKANSFTGTFTLTKGVLDLRKPAGVDAIAGDLVIGLKGGAWVRLGAAHQIKDSAHLTFAGPDISGLDLQGHDEQFASLALQTHAVIDLGDKPVSLIVGDSSAAKWDLTKTLTIRGFEAGKDRIRFGKDDKGLSPAQLARIGFANPAGMPDGLYTARIGPDGQLSPALAVKAANPPFDLSDQARAVRAKLYETDGLAKLSGPQSPLKDGMTISFFGDSITWLGGYVGAIGEALKKSPAAGQRRIKLINRGINGGGVLQIRDGAPGSAYPGNSPQAAFAQVIAADKADLAVVYIGINDIWWRKTTPQDFEKALRDLVAAARANKTTLVLATLSIRGELPHGANGDDAKIEQFAELTRKVARDTKTTLVDLRKAYIAWLQNHNAELRVDGSLHFEASGLLTYDGVHPSDKGVKLMAGLIGDGIFRALEARPQ